MDIVNFPGIIAEHGLLSSAQVDLAKDLILIGKKMGVQRDGTQYENMAITVAQFANLIGGGGNQTLAQTLADSPVNRVPSVQYIAECIVPGAKKLSPV